MLIWRQLLAPDGRLDEESVGKLLFASDLRYFEGEPEIDPYFEFDDALLESVGATEPLRERVNRGTALEVLGLE